MNEAQIGAIATANAYLNNVGLPAYTERAVKITVEVKNVYGVEKIYPVDEAAKIIARIAGTATLSVQNIVDIGILGIEVVEVKRNYQAIADAILSSIKARDKLAL